MRKLGIPTVLDRFIQQAVLQVPQGRWDRTWQRSPNGSATSACLKLIRAFLRAGVMEGGLVSAVDEGTPQGGPLSPLLSNIVLDEFDRELERRGLRFARYADDSNIYVRSRRAGERVMESITRFITTKLKLKVNEQKSAVARPWERKFPGIQLHESRRTKTADSAESGGPVQTDTGTNPADAGREHGTHGWGSGPVSTRLDRLFR